MTHTHKKTSSVLVALPGTRSRNPFPTPAARCTLGARPSAEGSLKMCFLGGNSNGP